MQGPVFNPQYQKKKEENEEEKKRISLIKVEGKTTIGPHMDHNRF
jgi:hypothetical protein